MTNGEEAQRRIFLYNDRTDMSFFGGGLVDCIMFCVQGDKPGESLPGLCGMARLEVVKGILSRGYELIIDITPNGISRPLSPEQRREYASVIGNKKKESSR
jgi:hypothetical protein